MNKNDRFLMRYEYFGGIIHDMETVSTKPIMQAEWDLLVGTLEGNEGKQNLQEALKQSSNVGIRENVKWMQEIGALDKDLNLQANIYKAPYPLIEGTICAPLRTYLHITDGCHLRCAHCMFSCGKRNPGELSTEQLFELVRILSEVRCPELRITGGEPTIRKDLFQVIQKAKDLGLYVMLNTSGIYGDKIRKQLISSGLDAIIVSLDGEQEQYEIRRGKNTYQHIIETLKFFSVYNRHASGEDQIDLTINFTFGRSNIGDLPQVVKLCAKYNVNVNLSPLRPYGTTKVKLMDDMLTPKEFLQFTKMVMEIREYPEVIDAGIKIIHKNFDLFAEDFGESHLPTPFNHYNCGAAGLGLGINPDGKLNVCGFLSKIPKFQGPNILETSFFDFWFSPVMHSFRTVVKRYCEPCKYYRKQCKGSCRAMAYAAEGDLGGKDTYCFAPLLKD